MSQSTKKIALLFVVWLMSLLITGYLGLVLLPSPTGSNIYRLAINPNVFTHLANWDGNAYLTIANKGYFSIPNHSLANFFPLYPLVIKIVSFLLLGNYLASGLLVSWASFFLALFYLYKLIKLDFSENIALKSIIYLLVFPFSFFFLAVYTESLFLLVTIAGFYYLRKSNFKFATLFGITATATRVIGIALLPAFLFEIWETKYKKQKLSKESLLLFTIPFGLLSYMLYLWNTKHNGLYFLVVEDKSFKRSHFSYPFKVLLSYIKHLVIHPNNIFASRDSTIIALEFIISVLFFIAIIFVWTKVRKSYAIYSFIAWSLPLMSGQTGSMLRYVLALFPCFILFAILGTKYKWLNYFYLLLCPMLLGIFTVSFINGYWVA